MSNNNFPLEDWLDSQDVMMKLHISLRTLHKLRDSGTLPYSRINNKIYFRRQDLEAILNNNYTRKPIDFTDGKIIKQPRNLLDV